MAEHGEKGEQLERVRRFLQWTLDDFNLYRQLAEEEIGFLEKKIDDIPPLEPAQREADLLSLLDTYYSYLDWVKDRIEEFEGDLEQLSEEDLPGGEFLESGFQDMVTALKELEKILLEKIERFDAESKRLADILERRYLLQARIDDLSHRLEEGERRPDNKRKEGPEEKEHAGRLKAEISSLRKELLSLPQVDEAMLAHYQVITEMGVGEAEWIAMLISEYDMLRQLAPLLPRDTRRVSVDLEKGMRWVARGYEKEIDLLKRKIDALERKHSEITSVGTLRVMERSRELAEIYEQREIRYNDLVNRLRIRIGAWEAEAARVGSAGK